MHLNQKSKPCGRNEMTDLIKRLHHHANGDCDMTPVGSTLLEAADRIEALERENHRWKMDCEEFWRARESKAVDVIKCILASTYADDNVGYHVALYGAKALLAELEKTE
jgi:hypothetical protein